MFIKTVLFLKWCKCFDPGLCNGLAQASFYKAIESPPNFNKNSLLDFIDNYWFSSTHRFGLVSQRQHISCSPTKNNVLKRAKPKNKIAYTKPNHKIYLFTDMQPIKLVNSTEIEWARQRVRTRKVARYPFPYCKWFCIKHKKNWKKTTTTK